MPQINATIKIEIGAGEPHTGGLATLFKACKPSGHSPVSAAMTDATGRGASP